MRTSRVLAAAVIAATIVGGLAYAWSITSDEKPPMNNGAAAICLEERPTNALVGPGDRMISDPCQVAWFPSSDGAAVVFAQSDGLESGGYLPDRLAVWRTRQNRTEILPSNALSRGLAESLDDQSSLRANGGLIVWNEGYLNLANLTFVSRPWPEGFDVLAYNGELVAGRAPDGRHLSVFDIGTPSLGLRELPTGPASHDQDPICFFGVKAIFAFQGPWLLYSNCRHDNRGPETLRLLNVASGSDRALNISAPLFTGALDGNTLAVVEQASEETDGATIRVLELQGLKETRRIELPKSTCGFIHDLALSGEKWAVGCRDWQTTNNFQSKRVRVVAGQGTAIDIASDWKTVSWTLVLYGNLAWLGDNLVYGDGTGVFVVRPIETNWPITPLLNDRLS